MTVDILSQISILQNSLSDGKNLLIDQDLEENFDQLLDQLFNDSKYNFSVKDDPEQALNFIDQAILSQDESSSVQEYVQSEPSKNQLSQLNNIQDNNSQNIGINVESLKLKQELPEIHNIHETSDYEQEISSADEERDELEEDNYSNLAYYQNQEILQAINDPILKSYQNQANINQANIISNIDLNNKDYLGESNLEIQSDLDLQLLSDGLEVQKPLAHNVNDAKDQKVDNQKYSTISTDIDAQNLAISNSSFNLPEVAQIKIDSLALESIEQESFHSENNKNSLLKSDLSNILGPIDTFVPLMEKSSIPQEQNLLSFENIEQITEGALKAISLPDKTIVISLHPEELGPLTIKIHQTNDGAHHIELSVDKPETLSILNKQIKELEKIIAGVYSTEVVIAVKSSIGVTLVENSKSNEDLAMTFQDQNHTNQNQQDNDNNKNYNPHNQSRTKDLDDNVSLFKNKSSQLLNTKLPIIKDMKTDLYC